jgi:hypothetical protein
VTVSGKHGNESSGFMKDEFFDHLSDSWLVKDSAPCS